ncbi:MAG: ATP-binding protein [Candidatus Omnitrophota bacterium]
MDAILKEREGISLVRGPGEDHIQLNEEIVPPDTAGLQEIYACFLRFKISAVVFQQGLTSRELADFLQALASSIQPPPEILQKGSEHILVRAQRPGEEPSPVLDEEGHKVRQRMTDFLSGRVSEMIPTPAAVFHSIDSSPEETAQAVLESARQTGNFDSVIKKFTEWFSLRLAPLVLERKKNPSGFIERMFAPYLKNNLEAVFPTVREMVAVCSDEIKMAMVFQTLSLKSAAGPSVDLAVKVLSDERDQERLLAKLPAYMTARSLPSDKAEEFTAGLKAELSRDEDVSVSGKQLSRLLRVSENFEEELEDRVRAATEELVRLNKRLADEKERTDAIMRHVAEGVVVVDREGRILMMNPAAEKLLDSKSKESLGKHLVASLKDEHLLAVAKHVEAEEGRQLTKEIQLDSKDETTKKILRASTAVVENEDGDTIGMVSVLSDITHEKQIEEIKSQFVSLVTHELRTPVVAIQKSLELIDSGVTGPVNEDQKRFLTISKLNLARLNSLINDLLDMSKLEAGKLVLLPSSFDFRKVIQEVKTSLLSWINDKDISLKLDLPKESVLVSADRERMVQVLVNLLGNALKFTPKKGEVRIALHCLPRKERVCEEPCVEMVVRDSGIGIDPKDFKRIFNKFEQVSLVSPVGTGGTGLGLSIAKEIIGLHAGAIWVESEKGKGSTFTFIIPRAFHGGKKSVS